MYNKRIRHAHFKKVEKYPLPPFDASVSVIIVLKVLICHVSSSHILVVILDGYRFLDLSEAVVAMARPNSLACDITIAYSG